MRSWMLQKWLSSLSVMYCYKSILEDLSLVDVVNEFAGLQTDRKNPYGRFTKTFKMFQIHFIIDLSLRRNISYDETIRVFVFLFILFLLINWSKNGCFRGLRALWNAKVSSPPNHGERHVKNFFPYFWPSNSKTRATTPVTGWAMLLVQNDRCL